MGNFDIKNPTIQKVLLSFLLAGGAMGMFFFTHLLPFSYPNTTQRLNGLKADYEQKSMELARTHAAVADLPRFEAEYDQLHQRWELASELLPTDRQLSGLLRKITLAGQQTGVQFVMFRPSGPREQEYHTELPVQIQVTGGYHQVGSFLSELANLRRIVTVSDLKLTTSPAQSGFTTKADFTASAYSLNTSSSGSNAAKKGENNARKS